MTQAWEGLKDAAPPFPNASALSIGGMLQAPPVLADDNDRADDLCPEYRREDSPAGFERGKYLARMAEGPNIVRIDPDSVAAFPDGAAVSEALRALLRIAERSARKP